MPERDGTYGVLGHQELKVRVSIHKAMSDKLGKTTPPEPKQPICEFIGRGNLTTIKTLTLPAFDLSYST